MRYTIVKTENGFYGVAYCSDLRVLKTDVYSTPKQAEDKITEYIINLGA